MVSPFDPDARAVMDGIVAAVGGGRSLHLGQGAEAAATLFRRRALDAVVFPPSRDGLAATLAGEPSQSADLVCAYGVLDEQPLAARTAVFAELLRIARRGVLLSAADRPRDQWEAECLRHPCRKHPLHQAILPYDGIDWRRGPALMLFEPLSSDVTVGRAVADLAAARDLHMDMLREAGRRADAHVARYMLARGFVRPGDRVLDAACGLGYGAAILADGTLADHVTGLDVDVAAIRYARDQYGRRRSRLTFETCDLSSLDGWAAGSFDVVVSFETLEHLADPDTFLAACRRLLTPAGRLICSVPNLWVDASGRDPNPHHLQVFDRAKLEAVGRRHFLIERVYGQTAGGGMKLPHAGRALWIADDPSREAEWWVLAAMVPPTAPTTQAFRSGLLAHPEDDHTNVLTFDRDYENPWLAKAMVTIGLRTESAWLLTELADETLADGARAIGPTADVGAALCVKVYRALDALSPLDEPTRVDIDRYCAAESANPHVRRWQISLRYAEAAACLQRGEWAQAIPALEACGAADAFAFSPLLCTKTVGASLLRGWLAAQVGDVETARRWWTAGIAQAERALGRPWDEFLLSRRAPALFGLREATLVVDLASRCATGLHLLPQIAERPGVMASQIFDSVGERSARDAERVRELEGELRAARHEIDRLQRHSRAVALLGESDAPLPRDLKIAIFGAGSGGRQALRRLRARGGTVTCLADNDPTRHGVTLDGVLVVDPATLPEQAVDIIAVASRPGREAIFAQLDRMGYRAGRDVAVVGADELRSAPEIGDALNAGPPVGA